jgi:glycosyltransferase involved in cell wall biosynthesis
MKIVFIVQNLNRIASNTVVMNIILNIYNSVRDISLISIYKSGDDNYKYLLNEHKIKYVEFDSLQDVLCNISKLLPVINSCDIMHLHQYKANELGNLLQKFNTSLKLLSTCHSEEDIEDEKREYTGNAKIASIVRLREQSNFFRKHNYVVAISNSVKQYLLRAQCKEENINVVHNGVNYDSFPKLKEKKNTDYINFCQVGHILKLKNQLFSIKLIKYLKNRNLNVKLHLFGGSQWDKEYYLLLQDYVIKHNLEDNIEFYGELSFSKLFDNLQDMNIILSPSLTEGLSLALLEAFYFEIAAIVSSNGGMKEIVKDNETGLVIDINSNNYLDDIYKYCIHKKYIEQGKIARKIALDNFSSAKMAGKYLDLYCELLDVN